MSGVIEKLVKRYICPHCHRGRSKSKQISDHLSLGCLRDPAAKGCLTCANFYQAVTGKWDEPSEDCVCDAGIDVSERKIRHCEKWEAA
jgi:hypothetical protein